MYKCELTGKQVWPGVSMERKVMQIREKQYFEVDSKGKARLVGTGVEIVKEISVCPFHAAALQDTANTLPQCGVAPIEEEAPEVVAKESETAMAYVDGAQA